MIEIRYGFNHYPDKNDDLDGLTVQAIREAFTEDLNIDPTAQAQVGGVPVGEDYVVRADQTLHFIKPAGVKG